MVVVAVDLIMSVMTIVVVCVIVWTKVAVEVEVTANSINYFRKYEIVRLSEHSNDLKFVPS
jgi:hypothetical protein